MYLTLEIRWFYPGAIPDEITSWLLTTVGPTEFQPSRTDYYLRQPDRIDLSLKLREGRIEIKKRWRDYGNVQFHDRVGGTVESWNKWGFDIVADDQILSGVLQPRNAWTAIQKTRRLRTLTVSPGKVVRIISPGEVVDDGCEIEVTDIVVSGTEWWTFGLEAFGYESILEPTLQATMKYLIGAGNLPLMSSGSSWSYPAWLKQIDE